MKAMQVSNKTTALWLYLWFLDKITKIDEKTGLGVVLGRKPIKATDIVEILDCNIKTARSMFKCLEDNSYIKTIRTPYGHQVYVTKAVKIFGNKGRNPKSGYSLPREVQNLGTLSPKSGYSKKTVQLDRTITTEQSSEEYNLKIMPFKKYADDFEEEVQVDPDFKPEKKQKKASDDVQAVFDLFSNPARPTWRLREIERVAAKTLFDVYGTETLKKRLLKIEMLKKQYSEDPFFPIVNTPSTLLDKMESVERYLKV